MSTIKAIETRYAGRDMNPCRCGADSVKELGVHGYCATCYTELLTTFDPSVFEMSGMWVLDGAVRPDHGPRFAECRCLACGATAVEVVGHACAYCEHTRERMTHWQAEILLWPDMPDTDDQRYEPAMTAWGDRLGVAVDAAIITRDQARTAWDRMASRAVA